MSPKRFSRPWWVATGDRVARTAAQTVIFAIGANLAGWLDNWQQMLVSVFTMSLLSFAHAVAAPPGDGSS
jgi:hypothetical protein